MRHERRSYSPWQGAQAPRRILFVRFHALGDVSLVLPAASHVARLWPEAAVDLLTMPPADELAAATPLFRQVLTLHSVRSRSERIAGAIRTGLEIRARRYDIIVDLQRNYVSRIIRRLSGAPCWSEFDRFSQIPATERVLSTIALAGVEHPAHDIPVPVRDSVTMAGRRLLEREGWDGSTKLVVFNPAGLWTTRNWPISSYVELYRLWAQHEPVRVLVLGTERVREKSAQIARESGMNLIDLAGKTSAGEAFAILRLAAVIVTEDSGLMHMAWAAGVPIVALFGSSRTGWAAPQGERAVCLDSSDLDCGCCMEPACRFGDVHCLTRRAPPDVLGAALRLLDQVHTQRAPTCSG
ncbi:MAG TPA: glycosyltransferase family 9 protein [Bacteroidota bacterium]|nr:glycosyltransferase family 9 protein [Bacteroidota bacterium]